MRILLDQDIPIGVRRILSAHDVRSAFQMGWAQLNNGDLLDAAEHAGFDALVTADQNMVFQQNLAGRNIAVVVLSTNFWPTILAQPEPLRRAIANAAPGAFTLATFGRGRQTRRPPSPTC
jgi:predicted nuclease of predicted toxin-antitoxin system